MVTATQVRRLLSYDPATGNFHWLRSFRGIAAGALAGNIQPNGYCRICVGGKKFYAHRLAWLYIHGCWPPKHIDHRDAKFGDNRLRELRAATVTQNLANARRRFDNTSGFKGVSLHKRSGLWRARIQINKKQRTIGYFRSRLDAHSAYVAESVKCFGAFARAA